jgi:hypothetical protein
MAKPVADSTHNFHQEVATLQFEGVGLYCYELSISNKRRRGRKLIQDRKEQSNNIR